MLLFNINSIIDTYIHYCNPITINGEDLEDVKTFTYLGSIIDEQGGSDANMKVQIRKEAYLQLKNILN
ncbi:unnamed protein product [Schistosoma margrebowiei]|uniref:Uncharacterized protein n=1 Tax=Schistosoma margrebowiei TaxID=48269 RepID=A0A183LMK9_9TREM|nr:unnamed protein product [Schistosoma margrebowiei]